MNNTTQNQAHFSPFESSFNLDKPWIKELMALHSYGSKDRCFVKYFYSKKSDHNSPSKIQFFFIHDVLEHHFKWAPLVSNMSKSGLEGQEFILHDFRGHGLSNGIRAHMDDFSIFCKDLASLINLFRKNRDSDTKVVLVGQGVGALVILKTIEQYRHLIDGKISSLILFNPTFKFNFEAPKFFKLFSGNLANSTISKIRFKRPYSGTDIYEFMSDAEEFNADPLIPRTISLGLMNQIVQSAKELRQFSYFVDAPALFFCGGKGPLFDPESAFLFHKGIPNHNSLYIKYPEEKHSLLYGNKIEDIYLNIKNWINNILNLK